MCQAETFRLPFSCPSLRISATVCHFMTLCKSLLLPLNPHSLQFLCFPQESHSSQRQNLCHIWLPWKKEKKVALVVLYDSCPKAIQRENCPESDYLLVCRVGEISNPYICPAEHLEEKQCKMVCHGGKCISVLKQ